ncbi:MAG: hypothetical protein JXA67_01745 [Micromonosporaceae bacterium]|nr:hypothetical protein [Micromonosporaceae bacterium]
MDADHPFIDFDGDGHRDSYETYDLGEQGHEFVHTDATGDVTAIAYDYDGDGLIDAIDMDHGHTGHMTHHYEDVNGDGWMDTETPIDYSGDEGDASEGDAGEDEGEGLTSVIGSAINYDGSLPGFLAGA